MKKLFVAFVICIASLASCIENEFTNKGTTAGAVTMDASEITAAGFSFAARFDVKGSGSTPCQYGILVGTEPGMNINSAMLTERIYIDKPGSYDYSYRMNNKIETLPGLGVHSFKFKPGSTVYYRACIEIILPDGSKYCYGDEKSMVVPEEN